MGTMLSVVISMATSALSREDASGVGTALLA